jgi:heme exporter protein A
MQLSGRDLSVSRGGRRIFEGLSFALSSGEFVAVTGANGAGKSTLLRSVAGLLRPDEGSVVLDPEPEAGRAIAIHYLGHLDGLKPRLTVHENLLFWRRLWQGSGDIDESLDTVGIGGLAYLHVSSLSAGQKRRVALARLLIHGRPVWLLDEPATSLDASGEAMLGRLVEAHLAGGGMVMAALHRPLPVAPSRSIALGQAAS